MNCLAISLTTFLSVWQSIACHDWQFDTQVAHNLPLETIVFIIIIIYYYYCNYYSQKSVEPYC